MAKLKEFRPETRFVIEHYEDVQLLQQALGEAETDMSQLLAAAQEALAEREWWDDDAWEAAQEGKKGFYAWKSTWESGDDGASIGIYDFSLDALLSGERTTWSYVYLPPKLRTEEVRALITKTADSARLKDYSSSTKYPFWRYLTFEGVGGEPGKIQEHLLAEFDALVPLIAAIDGVVARAK